MDGATGSRAGVLPCFRALLNIQARMVLTEDRCQRRHVGRDSISQYSTTTFSVQPYLYRITAVSAPSVFVSRSRPDRFSGLSVSPTSGS